MPKVKQQEEKIISESSERVALLGELSALNRMIAQLPDSSVIDHMSLVARRKKVVAQLGKNTLEEQQMSRKVTNTCDSVVLKAPTVKIDLVMEAIARALTGIDGVPLSGRARMIRRAAKAGAEAVITNLDAESESKNE